MPAGSRRVARKPPKSRRPADQTQKPTARARTRETHESKSQSRIHRLALQREHAEHTLVDAPQRLVSHEPLQRLDAERELTERERALGVQAALTQPRQVLGKRVLRPVDDAEILAARDTSRQAARARGSRWR